MLITFFRQKQNKNYYALMTKAIAKNIDNLVKILESKTQKYSVAKECNQNVL